MCSPGSWLFSVVVSLGMRSHLLCAPELNPLILSVMLSQKINGYDWNITLLFPNRGGLAVLGRTAASFNSCLSLHLSCCSTIRAGKIKKLGKNLIHDT